VTLLVPDSAEVIMLEAFLNKTAPEDLVIRLYSSNTTPAEADTVVTYTETTGGGYAAQNVTAASWTVTPGNPSSAAHPEITFTFSGAAGNVYGYYITQLTSGDLMWAERFNGAPFNIQNAGDEIKITPRITLE
jgi:hypothetical protein